MPPETELTRTDAGTELRALSEQLAPVPAAPEAPPAPAPASPWRPTMADFLFFALILWLFLAGPNGWKALLSDGDTGWHIRVGDWIREHGAFPRQDFLSFSRAGDPWFAWEWASEIAMSYLHEWAGLKGVVLGLGIWIPVYLLIVFRHAMWRGAMPLAALPLLLVAGGSSAIHYLARPHVFTLVFLAGSLWLLAADRRRETRWLWALVPVTAVWTNLHGGFLSLIACLGLATAGAALERNWPQAKRYGVLAAACLAASLANPYGYHLHEHIVAYLRSDWIKEAVDEFQSPSFRSEAMLFFQGILFLSLISVYRTMRRGEWVDTLLVVGWAHFALASVRHVPIFLLVAVPVLAAELSALWEELLPAAPKRAIRRTFDKLSRDLRPGFTANSAWVLAPVLALALIGHPIPWPKTFPDAKFPIALIEKRQADLAGHRVLTTDEWGDYLSYRFYPQQRVFFDGRSDFFGEKLGRIYLSLMQGGPEAEAYVEQFQFDTALLPPSWPLQKSLRRHPNWEVLADEKNAILLRRRVNLGAKKF